MSTPFGRQIVFGIPSEAKPVRGIPQGKARLKLRNEEFAEVFVRTPTGIQRFYLEDCGDYWNAAFEIGENRTIQRNKREAFDASGALVSKAR